ncbi:MAG: hypothetical protein HON90_04670, partial [Halobacteriovoraceae bacterium]|nr:hypothetical protein [Halobacteriovoraceae bacterium]
MKGKLILIPTPIDDESPLCTIAKQRLEQAVLNDDLIMVEEAKAGRRRWLHFGLPRETIADFILYNEHTRGEISSDIIKKISNGKNAYLMSDCGLPAFCDPGQELVELCHQHKIRVTATPFANSIALAIAVSGFPHNKFIFEGFISAKKEIRHKELKRILNQKEVSIIMDTPYRLEKLLREITELNPSREFCLA